MTAWPAAGTFSPDLNDGGEIRGWRLEAGGWRLEAGNFCHSTRLRKRSSCMRPGVCVAGIWRKSLTNSSIQLRVVRLLLP
jgi:hypothetical protein